jgi:23S rRNA (uridine2552-2'-O)-methyltransferase
MTVVDLGAAPGGWSPVAAGKVAPGGKVLAVDLLDMAPISGVQFLKSDFREADLAALLAGPADAVLSDAMPNVTGVPLVDQSRAADLILDAAGLCGKILKPEGIFLCKIFQGDAFEQVLRTLRATFQTVAVRKPAASRSESRETYFLARGRKTY